MKTDPLLLAHILAKVNKLCDNIQPKPIIGIDQYIFIYNPYNEVNKNPLSNRKIAK